MKSIPSIAMILFFSLFSFSLNAQYHSVIIHEIMADPDPPVGLPAYEWIEIKNTSNDTVFLGGWRVCKSSGNSGPMPAYHLAPDSFLIVCGTTAATHLSAYATTVSVTSFPSLSNGGDLIFLRSSSGHTIHAVQYSDAWYGNELKKSGGWSMEMIDPAFSCAGAFNWKASNSPTGGTPGRMNSVAMNNPDTVAPVLLRAIASDRQTVELTFDESIDSINAVSISSYDIREYVGNIQSIEAIPPLFDVIRLHLTDTLASGIIYFIEISGIQDCASNYLPGLQKARLAVFEPPQPKDIVINEVLFNPPSGGEDYVELYNNSKKTIDLKGLHLANRGSAGRPGSITQLSSFSSTFFPGDYKIFTQSLLSLMRDHRVMDINAVVEMESIPSYPDDEGNVLLLDAQGTLLDEVPYNKNWHFELIGEEEGVSLERILFDGPSDLSSNWHSASSDAGHGTPGYKNSQLRNAYQDDNSMRTDPPIFSPDHDGFDDFLLIHYHFPSNGNVISILFFDSGGRLVRSLVRTALAGTSGFYKWDGLDERGKPLPVGSYIMYAEVFDLNGRVKKYKKNVVIAARR